MRNPDMPTTSTALRGLGGHRLAVRHERHRVAADLNRQLIGLAALRVGLLNGRVIRPVACHVRRRRAGALPDQVLAVLSNHEIGVALLVGIEVLASDEQAVRNLMTGKLGHRQRGLRRVRTFPVFLGVEQNHRRARRRVEARAHRDELESGSRFLGVVEAGPPAADFDPVAGRRTWRRAASAGGHRQPTAAAHQRRRHDPARSRKGTAQVRQLPQATYASWRIVPQPPQGTRKQRRKR